MHNPGSGINHRLFPLAVLLLIASMITGCAKATTTPTNIPTFAINRTLFPEASATSLPTLVSPTATPTLLPTVGTPAPSEQSGVIIFAMGDGQYKHLFAYHPSFLPITRLTGDPWNFDFPAVNPDGSKIAYCSDQYGRWDIFILNLALNQVERVTQTESYACAPAWSPDGKWLAFEMYKDGRYDIIIYPIEDKSVSPIQLTENSGNNFSPTWSPDGRKIAFVTDRYGRSEIWIANLDDPENRFSTIASSTGADYSSPSWSPDGSSIAWSRAGQQQTVEVMTTSEEGSSIISLGVGTKPIWLPDGSGLLVLLTLPNQYDFTAYDAKTARLLLPPIPLPNQVSSFDWKAAGLAKNIASYLSTASLTEPASLWQPKISLSNPQTGRNGLVRLRNMKSSEMYLSDAVNESFESLRAALGSELGWDYLNTLENAALSLTAIPQAGIDENWLYTGRAIALNQVPMEFGWMAFSREDYLGQTYWRIWLKCFQQDGTCGSPVRSQVWDFKARYSNDRTAVENGGKANGLLEGYWLDFTEFASRYGWQRLPANSNWRTYYPGAQANILVLRESLAWKDAMLQLYPIETIESMRMPTP